MAFGRESGGDTGWARQDRQDTSQTPHWMKLLEERYHRLHAKIVNGAARFSYRRHSNNFLKGPTARCAKESRQASKRDVAGQAKIGDWTGDSNQSVQVDEIYGDERNEAENSDPACVSHAKINHTHGPTDGEGKLRSVNKPACYNSPRHGKGHCVTPLTNCFENDFPASAQDTPQTSGIVTRVSSALALTRLSSECDFSVNPSLQNSLCAERAVELRLALHSQLENENEEEEDSDENDNELNGLDNDGIVFDRNNAATVVDNEKYGYVTNEGECDNESVRCYTERADMEVSKARRRRRLHRSVKTSVSRVSHKTSKSCPANFWEDDNVDVNKNVIINDSNNNKINNTNGNVRSTGNSNPVPDTMLSLTARGVQESRMRVFARMSLEARHAVDETLKEMKVEEELRSDFTSTKYHTDDNVWPGMNPNPEPHMDTYGGDSSLVNNTSNDGVAGSQQRHGEAEEDNRSVLAESEVSIPSNNSNTYAPANRLGLKNQHLHNSSFHSPNICHSPHSSNFQGRRPLMDGHKSMGRRLPHLDRLGPSHVNKLPTPHARLPGIGGKLQAPVSFRENTFEITPPDFDIRFHQIITCQTGDRETPPLDVRQQSIEKCQQWLIRHTPRH